MMNYVWSAMLLFALVSAAVQGEMQQLSNAVLSSASDAVTLCIKLTGTLCLWGGLMNVAREAGITRALCRLLSPLLRLIFRQLDPSSAAAQAISMNVAANLLGMGNAATPMGLEAMRQLKGSSVGDAADDNMVKFVVMNSAALHLIPSTVAALRASAGSAAPLDIMPAAMISSAAALTVGMTAASLMLSWGRRGGAGIAAGKRMGYAAGDGRNSAVGARTLG